MAFTVSLPDIGVNFYDFAPCVRVLKRDGLNIADIARVREPHSGKRWLPAWTSREQAENFAVRLREESEWPKWEVYEVPDTEVSQGPLGPIEIVVNCQSDEFAYGVDPISAYLIRQRFPHAKFTPAVVIRARRADFEATQGPILDYIAIILTGLSTDEINELGGYRMFQPKGDKTLREAAAFVEQTV